MKFCPYCGADLIKPDAAFCVECGRQLSDHQVKKARSEPPGTRTRSATPPQTLAPRKTPRKAPPKRDAKPQKKRVPPASVLREYADAGYDGYYDDVLPPDLDRAKDGIDKELVKKIVALAVAALLIITLCVIMMYML